MAIRHEIILSTTEPNNETGLIKVRQADEATQKLIVQISENGARKPYTGLQAFFCGKIGQSDGLGIIEQKLTEEEMTDPEIGRLEYTFRAEDWQKVGRQIGYFSFRKMVDEHTFEEQFTTRDFNFTVIKNVFSEGLKEVKKDGSTYVWTIEDLLRLFKEYISTGKIDWEEFVEKNREILESADPGGIILSELLRSRKPEGAETAFKDLPARLDNQIGLNSEFRSFESEQSFMRRVFNESAERGINVKWYGAKGDGITNDTVAIQKAIDDYEKGQTLLIPNGTFLVDAEDEKNLKLKSDMIIKLEPNATVKTIPNKNTHYHVFDLTDLKNVEIYGGSVVGEKDEHLGTEGQWGHGFEIANSQNIYVHDVKINNFWGDGIELAGWGYDQRPRNTKLENLIIENCRRQGISVCSADGLEMNNIKISKIKGQSPASGIDFEPFDSGQVIKNVVVNNTLIEDCEEAAFLFATADIAGKSESEFDITINNTKVTGCRQGFNFYHVDTTDKNKKISGKVIVNKATISKTKENGVKFTDWINVLPTVELNDISIIETGTSNLPDWDALLTPVYLTTSKKDVSISESAMINFNGLSIQRNLTSKTRGIWVQPQGVFVYSANVINCISNFRWDDRGLFRNHRGEIKYINPEVIVNGDIVDNGFCKGLVLVFKDSPNYIQSYTLPKNSYLGTYKVGIIFPEAESDTSISGYIKRSGERLIFFNGSKGVLNITGAVNVLGKLNHLSLRLKGETWFLEGNGNLTH